MKYFLICNDFFIHIIVITKNFRERTMSFFLTLKSQAPSHTFQPFTYIHMLFSNPTNPRRFKITYHGDQLNFSYINRFISNNILLKILFLPFVISYCYLLNLSEKFIKEVEKNSSNFFIVALIFSLTMKNFQKK